MINLQLSVSGGYFQVVDFVNRLNGLPRLVVIDSLGLTTGGRGRGVGGLDGLDRLDHRPHVRERGRRRSRARPGRTGHARRRDHDHRARCRDHHDDP